MLLYEPTRDTHAAGDGGNVEKIVNLEISLSISSSGLEREICLDGKFEYY